MAEQVITTRFRTEGANRVAKDTEAVGRAQTRLGQASASSGRSFAAQANGLGGLVGVYAAAAANVFAITAAFDALGRAAQAEQIVRGTKLLALEIGQSGQSILDSVQQITQAQLTLAESSQNINIALSAGFNSDQIEQLSEVSLKASRALGRNLTDAFQRVVRGASKLEPELLDELGIFTRIDPAVEAYASKLNIAASSLTNYEKRQAFVNAVIEEGQKKFSAIDTSVSSSQKTFEQLRVTLVELATEFGILVANVLAPVAEFFKNNIGNALLLFGGILGLVFGRAVSAIGGFVGNSIQRLSAFTETLANSAAKMGSFSKAADALEGSVGRAKGAVGLKIFQSRIAGQGEGEAAALRDTLNFQEKGQLRTASAINRANKLYKAQLALLDPTSERFRVLNSLIDQNNAALKGAGIRAQLFIRIANALGVSVRGLGLAFSVLGGIISGLFTGLAVIQLAGSLFDRDFLKEIKDLFIDTSQRAEDLRVGILGAVDAAAGGNLVETLKSVGATKEDIENLSETISDTSAAIDKTANSLAFFNQLSSSAGRILGVTAAEAREFGESQRRLTTLQIALIREQEKGMDADRQRIVILRNLIKAQQDFAGAQRLVGGISSNLALSSTKVAQILKDQIQISEDGSQTFLKFARGVDVTDKSLSDLDESQQKVVTTFVLLENTLDKADKAFKGGSASAETLSKQLGGARKALKDFIDANTKLISGPGGTVSVFGGDPEEVKRQEQQIENIDKQVRSLKALETQGKALNDIFGKYNKVLDDAIALGTVGFNGIAKSAEDVIANQANFLARQAGLSTLQEDQIKNERVLQALQTDAIDRDSEQVKLVENRGKAVKALFGLAIQLPQEIEKERIARQNLLDQLNEQLTLQREQVVLQRLQNALALQNEQNKTQVEVAERRLNLEEKSLDVAKARIKDAEIAAQLELDVLKEQINQSRILARIDEVRAQAAEARLQAERNAGIDAAKSSISDIEAFPNLRSQSQLQAKQRELIDLELANQLAIIDAKERQAAREATRALDNILAQQEIIDKEIERKNTQIADLKTIAEIEKQLIDARTLIENQKIDNEIKNLQGQKTILDQQNKIANLQIDAQERKFQLDNENFERQIKGLEVQQAVVNKFVEALTTDNKFTQAIQAFLEEEGRADLANNIQQAGGPQQIASDFAGLRGLQKSIEESQENIIFSRREGANLSSAGQNAQLDEQIERQKTLINLNNQKIQVEKLLLDKQTQNSTQEIKNQIEILELKKNNLDLEIELINETFAAKQAGYEDERSAAVRAADERKRQLLRDSSTLGDLGNAVIGNINEGVSNAFNTAFDNLAQGKSITEGLGDVLRSTFESIRKSVLEETLIKPLQENIKSGLGGLFGFDEKGADNAKVIGGALLTTSADGSTPTEVVSDIKEKGVSAFESIGEKLGQFKDSALETFGSMGSKLSGVFSSVFSAIGEVGSSIFSSFGSGGGGGGLLSSLGGLFSGGKASGGIVHMAAGGMMRDRVPAMLEPGEFVMKRSSASQIGLPALNSMNATGSAGGDVAVNITNTGTPQEATASPPRFDGEKMVVDIVMRDLRNNGPIRKSLRGGA